MACLIAYSNYDNRFQSDASTNGPTAFVTDDGGAIAALAVTSTDLFYAVNNAIKRVPLDGGVASTWWTEDAGVTDLASDRASTIAWSAKRSPCSRRHGGARMRARHAISAASGATGFNAR